MNSLRQYFTNEIRQRCLSISALEREAGIPKKTLAHFLKGRRKLNNGHVEKIRRVMEELGIILNPSK